MQTIEKEIARRIIDAAIVDPVEELGHFAAECDVIAADTRNTLKDRRMAEIRAAAYRKLQAIELDRISPREVISMRDIDRGEWEPATRKETLEFFGLLGFFSSVFVAIVWAVCFFVFHGGSQ